VIVAAVTVFAQEGAPANSAFEVASIKPNTSGTNNQFIQRQPGGRVTVTNVPLRFLITFAYQLTQFQLVGGPGWVGTDRFDMVAKLEGSPEFGMPGSGPDPIQRALRTLLDERFKLKLRRETRQMDVYALVIAKPGGAPGPALKPATTDCAALIKAGPRSSGPPVPPPAAGVMPCNIMGSPGLIRFGGFPMSQFATMLVGPAGRMVIDRTSLAGNWEFELHFAAEQRGQPPGGAEATAADPDAPSLFTALEEQLGLKLESTKGPVDVFVIEEVERPTPD
jgi:uncharacterized protein (TIGR03435 family)